MPPDRSPRPSRPRQPAKPTIWTRARYYGVAYVLALGTAMYCVPVDEGLLVPIVGIVGAMLVVPALLVRLNRAGVIAGAVVMFVAMLSVARC